MNIMLLSPVRNIDVAEQQKIKAYVDKLEAEGNQVYWPIRDTDQHDTNGIRICRDNMRAITNADEIHVWFNPTSSGTIFDLGAAFYRFGDGHLIKFVFVNKKDCPDDLDGKSFIKVLKWLDKNT